VLAGLDGVCKLLSGELSTQCTSVVDQYFPLIWELVKTEVVRCVGGGVVSNPFLVDHAPLLFVQDSGEICKQIGLCNSTLLAIRKKQALKVSQILSK